MARKALDLTIYISGKMDKSLSAAIADSQKQIGSLSKVISNIGKAGLVAMGTAFTATAVAITKSTEAAADFESGMAKVYKYVDGLADEMGEVGSSAKYMSDSLKGTMFEDSTYAENVDAVREAVKDLSMQVPLAIDEIQSMFAKLGQSGVDLGQLISYDENGVISGYVNDVAKISAAFDMEAESVADMMMQAENAFGYNHDQVMDLFDEINYTAANSPTTAEELSNAVFRSLAMGEISGLGSEGTVALTDALLSAGLDESRVATTARNMLSYLSLGSSGTSSQQNAFRSIGLDPDEVASRMQTEGFDMLNEVFDRVRQLDKEDQIATLKNLFNLRTIEGGSMIANNPDMLLNAFSLANETEESRGYNSMLREYNIETATPEALSQMITNAKEVLAVDVGEQFLDVKTEAMRMILELLTKLHEAMPDLTNLANTVMPLISDAINTIADGISNALPYIQQLIDFIAANPGTAAAGVGGLAALFTGMSFAPAISNAGGNIANLLFGGKQIAKGGGVERSGGLLSKLWGGGHAAGSATAGAVSKLSSSAASGATGLFGAVSGKAGSLFGALKGALSAKKADTSPTVISGMIEDMSPGTALATVGSSALATTGSGAKTPFAQLTDNGTALVLKERRKLGETVSGLPSTEFATRVEDGFKWLSTDVREAPDVDFDFIEGEWTEVLDGSNTLGSILGKLGGGAKAVGGGALDGLTGFWGTVGGSFLSLFSGLAPIIALIGTLIALFGILGDHMEDIRGIVGDVFGEGGLEVFDSFTGKLSELGGFIDGIFNGGLADALSGVREMITGVFGEDAGTTFDSFVGILQSVLGVVGQVVDFGMNTVKPIIEEIFRFLVENVMPIVINTFNAAAPIISGIITNLGTAIMTGMNLIGSVIQALLPVIEPIILALMTAFSIAAPAILAAIEAVSGGIGEIVASIQEIFTGLIDFVTGVFTGDWDTAWQGVQEIFGGLFDGLVDLVKTPINTIVGLINTLIDGINEFVRGLSGNALADAVAAFVGVDLKDFEIAHLPELATGGFTNGVSIAGEAGREAVISFDPAYRAGNIRTWSEAGKELGVSSSGGMAFAPQITIQGSADKATVEAALAEAQSRFESWYNSMEKRRYRVAY